MYCLNKQAKVPKNISSAIYFAVTLTMILVLFNCCTKTKNLGNNTKETNVTPSSTTNVNGENETETRGENNVKETNADSKTNLTLDDFRGKIAVAYGDSIVYGAYRAPGDPGAVSRVDERWCDILSTLLEFKSMKNEGESGISISSTSSVLPDRAMTKQYNRLPNNAEVIFIAAGTNDFGTNVPLGAISDKEDTSFCGALYLLCQGLKEKYSDDMVIFITPISRKDEETNKLGHSLEEYRNMIKKIAGENFGFTVLNGESFGFEPENESYREAYMLDGLHPNGQGHVIYAQKVAEAILGVKIQ